MRRARDCEDLHTAYRRNSKDAGERGIGERLSALRFAGGKELRTGEREGRQRGQTHRDRNGHATFHSVWSDYVCVIDAEGTLSAYPHSLTRACLVKFTGTGETGCAFLHCCYHPWPLLIVEVSRRAFPTHKLDENTLNWNLWLARNGLTRSSRWRPAAFLDVCLHKRRHQILRMSSVRLIATGAASLTSAIGNGE